jgi:GMP synthase PP-ATPase subunit
MTRENLDILKEADEIFIEGLKKSGFMILYGRQQLFFFLCSQ